jgi:hypothetical protein
VRDSQLCGGSALLVSCNLSVAQVVSQANAISIWKVKSEREKDSGEGSLVGGVVVRLEPMSHGVGPSDLFYPCTPRFEMSLSLEPRKA